jgi:predicted MFS family arabinose efflux permease
MPDGTTGVGAAAPPTWGELMFGRYAAVAWTLCLGTGMHATAWYILATALPSTVADVGGATIMSWVVSMYLVASIVTGSSAGLLKSRFGARPVLIVGCLVFLAGTILAASASSMPMVVAGRALQGAGEGLIWAVTTMLVKDLLPIEAVPPMYAILGVVWSLAAVLGPLMSGLLVESVGWRGALLSMAPFGLLFLALVLTALPPVPPSRSSLSFPLPRLLLIAAGVVALSIGGVIAAPVPAAVALVVAVAFVAVALVADRRATTALFPRDLTRLRSIPSIGIGSLTVMFLAEASIGVFVALLAQTVFGMTPLVAGYTLAVVAFAWTLSALLVARITGPLAEVFIVAAPVLLVVGMAATAVALGLRDLTVLFVALVVIGVAFGLAYTLVSQRVLGAARPEESDVTAGALPTLEAAGAAFGAAIAGLVGNMAGIAAIDDPAAMASAGAWVMVVSTVLALPAVAGAIALIRLGRPAALKVSG